MHGPSIVVVKLGQQSVMCGREYAMGKGDEARLMEAPSRIA